MKIGNVKSVKISQDKVLCEIDHGNNDVETATLYGPAGSFEYPLPGDTVIVEWGKQENIITAVYRPAVDGVGSGERIMYSRSSSGDVSASIKLTADGEIILNGGTDNGVSFSALKSGFDSFTNWATLHTHPAPGGTTSAPGAGPTASIDDAKVDKVKI